MAQFTIDIPDELTPGIIATAYAEEKDPGEILAEYAVAMATKTCQDMKVGPFYVGPTPPQFNADGSPYGISGDLVSSENHQIEVVQ